LDSQLRALKLAGAAGEKGIKIKPSNLSQLTREQQGNEKYIGKSPAVLWEILVQLSHSQFILPLNRPA